MHGAARFDGMNYLLEPFADPFCCNFYNAILLHLLSCLFYLLDGTHGLIGPDGIEINVNSVDDLNGHLSQLKAFSLEELASNLPPLPLLSPVCFS